MGYSHGMTTKLITAEAPEISEGYPYKRRVFPAWQDMWDRLRASQDALDGRLLAEAVAPEHDLSADTLWAVLSRAAAAGLLTRESRAVAITVNRTIKGEAREIQSTRARTFYRIAG